MSIHKEENVVFSEWAKKRKNFVRDGVVNEKAYLASRPKIVFILKEANGGDSGDIRNWLRSNGGANTWCTVARWVYGIRDWEQSQKWTDFENKFYRPEFRIEMLKSICAMNLKKSVGEGSTKQGELDDVARKDQKHIRDQYKIYKPDITICGGTGDLFREVIGHNQEWQQTSRGERWYEREDKKFVVDASHPARPIENTLKFYSLIDAINEIYDKQN